MEKTLKMNEELYNKFLQLEKKYGLNILQNLPKVVEREYSLGRIENKDSMIIRGDRHTHTLSYQNLGYGAVFIRPHTLDTIKWQ